MSKKNKKEQNAANDNAKHRRLSETEGDTDKEESGETIKSAQCLNRFGITYPQQPQILHVRHNTQAEIP